jgi:hypothetical protein
MLYAHCVYITGLQNNHPSWLNMRRLLNIRHKWTSDVYLRKPGQKAKRKERAGVKITLPPLIEGQSHTRPIHKARAAA